MFDDVSAQSMLNLRDENEILSSLVDDSVAVSVIVPAYNQLDYIHDTVQGILAQKTNFYFEIILHDDASKDGTQEIILMYTKHYPNIIIPVLREVNVYQKGISPIAECLKLARGKYVAICEGDDFWTSPDKLQAQYDFMEKNKKYTFMCHNAKVHYIDTNVSCLFNKNLKAGPYSTVDLIFRKWFIPTASLFFRKNIIAGTIPDWYGSVRSQDLALEIMLSLQGDFWYQDEVMSVYRKNAIGSLSSRNEKPWNYLKLRIFLFKKLSDLFPMQLKPLAWLDIILSMIKIVYAKVLSLRN